MKITKKTLSFLIFGIIFVLAFLLILLDYSTTLTIASLVTLKTIQADVNFIDDIQEVNKVLINTEKLKSNIQSISAVPTLLLFLGGIMLVVAIICIIWYDRILKNDKPEYDTVIKKWKFLPKPDLLIGILFASFLAVSLAFYATMNLIELEKTQTITVMIPLTIDTKQPEMISGILETYLNKVNLDFFHASTGFVYFGIASIFPLMGLIYFIIKKGLNVWAVTFFFSPLPAIPMWFILFRF